ncbi:MAG: hypothetical protein VKI81_05130 [Synechococcaceae cyanobacterium]|nr:hypothetical protein [Synechococcaceae cyanobacterium]
MTEIARDTGITTTPEAMVADIRVVDPKTVQDNAIDKAGEQGLATSGIPTVITNGTQIVKNSRIQSGVLPGQAIRHPAEKQGRP